MERCSSSQLNFAHPAEVALARAEWQPVLFAERPSRFELGKLKPNWPANPLTIRVHRNHSFEHVADAANAWFAWQGLKPEFQYSDYDDSLSFASVSERDAGSMELISDRFCLHYTAKFAGLELVNWLENRLTALRALSKAPILVGALGIDDTLQDQLAAIARELPGTRLADLRSISDKLGPAFLDERAARFSGTRLSDRACVLIAREFACRWSPSLLYPRLKAVVLDLDHTLYDGVLGEDGLHVKLTPAHVDLQNSLVKLRGDGLFLALVSRNEETDVKELFEQRTDFPLRWEHFSARAIGWGNKAEGIRQVATSLRIGLDAVLYVDDNPGELASVVSELPMISTAHAMQDAAGTCRMLEYYPKLWAWERSTTDALRASDLKFQAERDRLAAQATDPLEYLRSLQVRIRIEVTPHAHLARLHELSQKTNQFNLNRMRYSEVALAEALDAQDYRVAVVELADRMSNSGQIALIVAQREKDALVVHEIAVSCRALGRNLENFIIAEAIQAILEELPSSEVRISYRTGREK